MSLSKKKSGAVTEFVHRYKRVLQYWMFDDKTYIKNKFRKVFGYDIDFENPKTLNEKLQCLKLDMSGQIYADITDKIKVRDYIRRVVGDKYLIPLYAVYDSPADIEMSQLPDEPFIVKTNHDCTGGFIVRNKSEVSIDDVRRFCVSNLANNHYYISREVQYKNIERRILVEKLLEDTSGNIPSDFKVNCLNGRAQFIYCSLDREGRDYRKIYDTSWRSMDMKWGGREALAKKFNGPGVPPPAHLAEMIEVSEKISAEFPYLRVDFYDIGDKLYIGELTLCHGAGFDLIEPFEYDRLFGAMLKI